jgi:proline dehydrogenase
VFKPTGLAVLNCTRRWRKTTANCKGTGRMGTSGSRLDLVCERSKKDVGLLIDAEESWMQDAADELALEMMRKYNKEKQLF